MPKVVVFSAKEQNVQNSPKFVESKLSSQTHIFNFSFRKMVDIIMLINLREERETKKKSHKYFYRRFLEKRYRSLSAVVIIIHIFFFWCFLSASPSCVVVVLFFSLLSFISFSGHSLICLSLSRVHFWSAVLKYGHVWIASFWSSSSYCSCCCFCCTVFFR